MGLLTDPGKSEIFKLLLAHYAKLSVLVYVIGIGWLFCLVDERFNQKTYFSENALLPGLVEHEFSMANEQFVTQQFKFLSDAAKDDNDLRKEKIKKSFQDLGLEVYDHFYNFSTARSPQTIRNGRGVYAILRAPRASSLESIVFTAPFREASTKHVKTDGSIAVMLGLAQLFRHKNYWAKDIIFVVTDNEHFGAKAWVEAYHGINPKNSRVASYPLTGRAGSIQAAICLELPSNDVDFIDLRFVGINGQMPNLDLINLVKLLLHQQQIQFIIQGNIHLLDRAADDYISQYLKDLDTVTKMIRASATGKLEGNHAFFQLYNIQALTLRGWKLEKRGRAIGFYRLSVALEGICRSINNLLERFHQSFFFYLMTSPRRFISIGLYIPPFALIISPLALYGVALWLRGTSKTPEEEDVSDSTVGKVLPWIIMPHCVGIALFVGQFFLDLAELPASLGTIIAGSNVFTFLTPILASGFLSKADAQLIKSLSLIEMCIGLYCLSMLNFSLALLIAIFSVPLATWTSNQQSTIIRAIHGLLIFQLYPVFPLILSNVWDKIAEVLEDPEAVNRAAETAGRSIAAVISQYLEYGNWLDPVIFLFLMPLWIVHWMLLWVRAT